MFAVYLADCSRARRDATQIQQIAPRWAQLISGSPEHGRHKLVQQNKLRTFCHMGTTFCSSVQVTGSQNPSSSPRSWTAFSDSVSPTTGAAWLTSALGPEAEGLVVKRSVLRRHIRLTWIRSWKLVDFRPGASEERSDVHERRREHPFSLEPGSLLGYNGDVRSVKREYVGQWNIHSQRRSI